MKRHWPGLRRFDEAAPLRAERDAARTALEHVRQQASLWAQEARTQKATVDGVGALVGQPDYGPIIESVAALRARVAQLEAENTEALGKLAAIYQLHGVDYDPRTKSMRPEAP